MNSTAASQSSTRPPIGKVIDLVTLGLLPASLLAAKSGQRKPTSPRLPKPRRPKHRYRVEVDSFSRGHYAVSSKTWIYVMHEVRLEMRDEAGQVVQKASCDCDGYAYRQSCTHLKIATAWHAALKRAWRRPGAETATARPAGKHWHEELSEAPGWREYYCPLEPVA